MGCCVKKLQEIEVYKILQERANEPLKNIKELSVFLVSLLTTFIIVIYQACYVVNYMTGKQIWDILGIAMYYFSNPDILNGEYTYRIYGSFQFGLVWSWLCFLYSWLMANKDKGNRLVASMFFILGSVILGCNSFLPTLKSLITLDAFWDTSGFLKTTMTFSLSLLVVFMISFFLKKKFQTWSTLILSFIIFLCWPIFVWLAWLYDNVIYHILISQTFFYLVILVVFMFFLSLVFSFLLSCDIYCSIKKNNALHVIRRIVVDKQPKDKVVNIRNLEEYENSKIKWLLKIYRFQIKKLERHNKYLWKLQFLNLTDHIKIFFSGKFLLGLVIPFLLFISSPIFISFSYNDICGKKDMHACKARLAFGFNKKLANDKQSTKIDIKLYTGSAKIYRLQLNQGSCVVYMEQKENACRNKKYLKKQDLYDRYLQYQQFIIDYANGWTNIINNQPLSESIKFLSEIKNKPIQTLKSKHETMSIYTSCKNTDIHNIALWVEYKGRLEKIEHDF